MPDLSLIAVNAGPRGPLADGTNYSGLRVDKDGSLVTTAGHGDMAEAARRKRIFVTANQTGVASQSGLSAATPVLTLYNPSSAVLLSLLMVTVVLDIAVAAGGCIPVVALNTAAPTALGSAATVRNYFGNNDTSPLGSALLAPTLAAAPVAVALLGFQGSAATTVPYNGGVFQRDFKGGLLLPVGCAMSVQTLLNASGAVGMLCEYVWEEIPLT